MANEQNLIRPSSEEARKNGRKGGIASGAARRARKTLKEELLLLLETDGAQERMCYAILKQATEGNTKAFEVIRDSIGEKPVETIRELQPQDNKLLESIEQSALEVWDNVQAVQQQADADNDMVDASSSE